MGLKGNELGRLPPEASRVKWVNPPIHQLRKRIQRIELQNRKRSSRKLNEKAATVDTAVMSNTRQLCIVTLGLLVTSVVSTASGAPDEAQDYHPHAQASCSTCHGRRASSSAEEGAAQAAAEMDVCATCHDQHSPVETSLGAWGPDGWPATEQPADDHGSSCTRCHSFHDPTAITFGDRRIEIADAKVGTHCQSCHSHSDTRTLARLTEGHVAAAALYHWLGPELGDYTLSDACLICHDRNHTLPTNLPVFLPVTPRFETHASHPYGIRMDSGGDFFRPVIDSRIPLFDDKIECLTCHDLSAETEDLVIRFETKYEMCRGCHTQGLPQGQFQELVEN